MATAGASAAGGGESGGSKVQQRVLDRERKALLAKVSASPELIKEVERATQTLTASRQVISKLTRDRAREAKEVSRVRTLLEEGRSELKRLQEAMESNTTVLTQLEEELRLRQARVAERQRRRVRREQRRGRVSGSTSNAFFSSPPPITTPLRSMTLTLS